LGDYDQTRDIALGRVRAEGIDLTMLNFDVEEIFYRFHDRLEWDVSELSMGMYTSARSRGDDRFIAIPVFPSRFFRHSAIYVRTDGGINKAEDLAGKRIGVPQWSQTAGIYVRGFLSATVGLSLAKMKWIQAGVNEAGRAEPGPLKLPPDFDLKVVADRNLNDMMLAGEIDAIISARPPTAFTLGDGRVRRLFADSRSAEAAYFEKTSIFPIMHTIAIRRDVYDANRWVARNLFRAFEQAKDRSVRRMLDFTAAHVPMPWSADLAQDLSKTVFRKGGFWPYGVEANLPTLTAFLQYGYEQGVCHRRLSIEEVFAEEATIDIKV
jgi:4,5-dihydroxyphthalate decarboxylase